MIRYIPISKEDKKHIEALAKDETKDKTEYTGLVIRKPWGHEYVAFHSEDIAVWILYIKQGFQTSLHCHPNKKSSLSVLKGSAEFKTLSDTLEIHEGEGLLIEKGVFHSTKATSPGGIIIIETETPNNKTDLLRLEDTYGRKGKMYEGESHHASLEDEEFSDLKEFLTVENRYNKEKDIGNCKLTITRCTSEEEFYGCTQKNKDSDIIGVLSGKICDENGTCIYSLGDITKNSELKKITKPRIINEVELLKISKI